MTAERAAEAASDPHPLTVDTGGGRLDDRLRDLGDLLALEAEPPERRLGALIEVHAVSSWPIVESVPLAAAGRAAEHGTIDRPNS